MAGLRRSKEEFPRAKPAGLLDETQLKGPPLRNLSRMIPISDSVPSLSLRDEHVPLCRVFVYPVVEPSLRPLPPRRKWVTWTTADHRDNGSSLN